MSLSSLNKKGKPEMGRTCDCDKLPVEKVYFSTSAFDADLPTEKPGIFLWKFLNEEESVYLLKGEVKKKDILSFFEKKLDSETNNLIVTALLYETVKFCRVHLSKDPKLMSSLIGIMYFTQSFFVSSIWRTPDEVYSFFKESLLCHAVESPPFSMEIFQPSEAKETILYFYETYLRNLPLMRLVCLPHYRLKLETEDEPIPNIQTERTEDTKKTKI